MADLFINSHNSKDTSEIKVDILSINLCILFPLYHNNKNDFKNHRLIHFCRHILPKYDIVLCQEIWMFANCRQRILICEAEKLGFRHNVTVPYRIVDLLNLKTDPGLLILSKYPIRFRDHHCFQAEEFKVDEYYLGEKHVPKGIVAATVDIGGYLLHVVNCHLQASYHRFPKLEDVSVQMRLKQIDELMIFLRKMAHYQPEAPLLVMGDFNIDSRHSHEEYQQLVQRFKEANLGEFRDVLFEIFNEHPITYGASAINSIKSRLNPDIIPLQETAITTKADHNYNTCFDYVFWNQANNFNFRIDKKETYVEPFYIKNSKYGCTQVSDHYGVVAVLRITKKI